jgi:NitT/TauT family transport system ATP-binding protein
MNDNLLTLRDVSHAYDGVQALQGISLEIAPDEFVAVVGPSGCGKTTLLNLLSDHARPNSGTVQRHGAVRMIYQQDGLYPWLTAAENIALGLRATRGARSRDAEARELLAMIRLESFAHHYPHQLSGGMRQLVELARALAGDARILLMDEPFSALDYLARVRMRHELIRVLGERPRTVLFVTHDIEEAAQLADRVVVLSPRPGRIRCEMHLDGPRPRPITHPRVGEVVRRALQEMGVEHTLHEPEAETRTERSRAVGS